MLGKTPAGMALAAAVAVFVGTVECAAQSEPAAGETAAPDATLPAETSAQPAPPDAQSDSSFVTWRDRFRARALKAGIPHDVFDKALGNLQPDPKVREKDAEQPEFTRAIWDYLDGAVSDSRIENGRKMMRRHASLLAQAEKAYGVPARYLVAIWGLETSYGALLGSHNIFEALATLSYRGDRQRYGEEQLLAALRLLADGHKPLDQMKGSWAGAVGHTQFVPTTYLNYAVDGDNDGRRDLWDSLSDVFHSTAHYLKESGFDPSLKWGREAFLPDDFDYALAGYHVSKPLSEWRELGVKMANGALVPDLDVRASVLVPAGHQGPAFLVYENFHAILEYNRSTSYALAIGLLSDQLIGGPSLKQSWPRHLKPLSRDERLEIQRRLSALGYGLGDVDGILGRETRKAIRAFQKDQGDIADGYATPELITKLRSAEPRAAGERTAQAEPETVDRADGDAPQTSAGDDASQTEEVAALAASENDDVSTAEVNAPGAASGTGDTTQAPETSVNTTAEAETTDTNATATAEVAAADTASATPAETQAGTAPAAEPAPLPRSKDEEIDTAAAGEAQPEPSASPTPTPRSKDEELAGVETGDTSGQAETTVAERVTPRPRAKPEATSDAAPDPQPTAAAAVDPAPAPQPGPVPANRLGGVLSTLASPGLVILRNGVAAPAEESEPSVRTGTAMPVNSSSEPIVSPPGTAYVGTDDAETSADDGADEEGAPGTDDLSENLEAKEKPESPGS